MKKIILYSSACLMLIGAVSCSSQPSQKTTPPSSQQQSVQEAFAMLNPTQGNKVKGRVSFTKVPQGVKVVADFEGMEPGSHGIHIHEKGDCSAPDGSSAGEHFNPTNKKHGSPDDKDRHVGDLGNIVADRNGRAHYERVDSVIQLDGDYSIIGRSVVIHAKADDFKTQPSGDSGKRVACGVIETLH